VQLGDQAQLFGVQDRDLPLGGAQPIHDLAVRGIRILEHVFDNIRRPSCQPLPRTSVDKRPARPRPGP